MATGMIEHRGIVQRVEAVVHFNQRHVFLPGTGGYSGRHFFCAA